MASGKVKAALAGRQYARPASAAPAATSRFGVVPKDQDLVRVQEDLRASGDGGGGGSGPFSHGQLIEVTFDTSTNGLDQTIPTKLGGPAAGFIVVDKVCDIAVDIVRDDYTTSSPIINTREESHIKLRASSACKTKIWVWR